MRRKGIANKTDGINFRSLLEAKWARFFYYLDWNFQYEPYELDGWIPDFSVAFDNREVLFEIKPAMTMRDLVSETEKAINHAGNHIIACAGACVDMKKGELSNCGGLAFDHNMDHEPFMIIPCIECQKYAFTHLVDSYEWDCGSSHLRKVRYVAQHCGNPSCDVFYDMKEWKSAKKTGISAVQALWKSACNDVQWRGVSKRIYK